MIKQAVKNIFVGLKWDITKNMEYDRFTKEIIKRVLKPSSICIDVGCHKGEILDLFFRQSQQKHYAFEPIPEMNKKLSERYGDKIYLFDCALSDEEGTTTFNYVKNAPAYSGIKQRKYKVKNPHIEKFNIELKRLDDIILNKSLQIDLIKIDVEGAELNVLKGAEKTIRDFRPVIIFECGLGASEYYGTKPQEVFHFFQKLDMKLFLLKKWINNESHLQEEEFVNIFNQNKEYYFLASS